MGRDRFKWVGMVWRRRCRPTLTSSALRLLLLFADVPLPTFKPGSEALTDRAMSDYMVSDRIILLKMVHAYYSDSRVFYVASSVL